jgi:hypothetical protein
MAEPFGLSALPRKAEADTQSNALMTDAFPNRLCLALGRAADLPVAAKPQLIWIVLEENDRAVFGNGCLTTMCNVNLDSA